MVHANPVDKPIKLIKNELLDFLKFRKAMKRLCLNICYKRLGDNFKNKDNI